MHDMRVKCDIRRLMARKGIGVAELAEKMEVTQFLVWQWQSGLLIPKVVYWPRLTRILDCSLDELIIEEAQ